MAVIQTLQGVGEDLVSRKLTAPSTAVVSADADKNETADQGDPRYHSRLDRWVCAFLERRLRLTGIEKSAEQHSHAPERRDLAYALACFYELFVGMY
jgi:hypothetical protein